MEGSVDDAGPRRRRMFGLRGTPWFALVVGAITVSLAGIVLAVSILVFLEAREPAATDASDEALRGDGFRGARVFVRADCANCHTLTTAGATGTRGPNLDRHFSTHAHSIGFLVAQISNGGNGMPAFRNRLTEQEIRDVATFIADVAGRAENR
jgi:mono/diheme cytochrome c family protein